MQTIGTPALWVGFGIGVLLVLFLDLFVLHRDAHEIKPREALFWSVVWISLALVFGGFVYWQFGSSLALQYLTGWLIEKALSVDNLFVIMVVMGYFAVPPKLQHNVLFWGILGALVFRAVFILAGTALLQQFKWVMYVFGGILIFTAVRLMLQKEEEIDPGKNKVLQLARRIIPGTSDYREGKFFVRENGRRLATPLLFVIITVEATDIMFAIDSIPAIFAVSSDPFIVYTSNVFAILGLRALYFLVASILAKFHLLKYGLSVVLAFVGVKMLVSGFGYHVPIGISLGVVAGVIALSMVASVLFPKKHGAPENAAP